MVFSGLVALTLSPALAALLIKPGHGEKHGFFKWFERVLERATNGYVSGARWIMKVYVSRFEGEKNVLAARIESLNNLVTSQAAQISDLSKKHEQAYEKVQDIANRAVAAAKHESYSTPSHLRRRCRPVA